MPNDIEATLDERAKTHGDFLYVAGIAQGIKILLRTGPSWNEMNHQQREALEMVASKLARAVSGDHNEIDHLFDTIGYCRLYMKAIDG